MISPKETNPMILTDQFGRTAVIRLNPKQKWFAKYDPEAGGMWIIQRKNVTFYIDTEVKEYYFGKNQKAERKK